jgi:transcriptional regulator with XRE-family HTH domain
MDTPATLAEYLRAAREQAGLSQRQLASRVGIHHSYVAQLESGDWTSPSADVLQRIADVLEIASIDLFAFIGIRPTEGLPELAPYLRAKYHLDDDQIRKATVYFRRSGWYLDRDANLKRHD